MKRSSHPHASRIAFAVAPLDPIKTAILSFGTEAVLVSWMGRSLLAFQSLVLRWISDITSPHTIIAPNGGKNDGALMMLLTDAPVTTM